MSHSLLLYKKHLKYACPPEYVVRKVRLWFPVDVYFIFGGMKVVNYQKSGTPNPIVAPRLADKLIQ